MKRTRVIRRKAAIIRASKRAFQEKIRKQMESCGVTQMGNASTQQSNVPMDVDADMGRKMSEDGMTDTSNTVKQPSCSKDQKQLSRKQKPSPSYNHQEQFEQRAKRPKICKKRCKQKRRMPSSLSDDGIAGRKPAKINKYSELSYGSESSMPFEMKQQSNDNQNNNDNAEGSGFDRQESANEYVIGGYHPVAIGDVFVNRYHVFKKLGWGHFSTVWLCYDTQMDRYCAVKVSKSAQVYKETGIDEIMLFSQMSLHDQHKYRSHVVGFYDFFEITGPHGRHICLVLEVLGDNLLKVIERCFYKGMPISNIKQIAQQVLTGLKFLHEECGIIHTDLKPENVLLASNEVSVRTEIKTAIEVYLKANEGKLSPRYVRYTRIIAHI